MPDFDDLVIRLRRIRGFALAYKLAIPSTGIVTLLSAASIFAATGSAVAYKLSGDPQPGLLHHAAWSESSLLERATRARQRAQQGDVDGAITATREILVQIQQECGNKHPYCGILLNDLSGYFRKKGDLSASEEAARRAVQILKHRPGRESGEYAVAINDLATVLALQGEYYEAAPLYRQAYITMRKLFGDNDARVLTVGRNLALLSIDLEDFEQAEELLIQSARTRENAGASSAAIMKFDLARLYLAQGKTEMARRHSEQALQYLKGESSPDIKLLVRGQISLAAILTKEGKLAEAEERLRETLVLLDKSSVRDEYGLQGRAHYLLGNILSFRGFYPEAEAEYKLALQFLQKRFGKNNPGIARAYHALAQVYQELGQYDLSEPYYERAISSMSAVFGADHHFVARTRIEQTRLLILLERYKAAVKNATAAVDIYRKQSNLNGVEAGIAISGLAYALKYSGQYRQAKPVYIEAIDTITTAAGGSSTELPVILTEFAELNLYLGDYRQSEELLDQALAIRKSGGAAAAGTLGRSQSVLIDLRVRQDRLREALEIAGENVDLVANRYALGQESLSSYVTSERRNARFVFEQYLDVAERRLDNGADTRLTSKMFEVAQYPHLTDTAAAVSRMAVRFVPEGTGLRELVRKKQNAVERWKGLDRALSEELMKLKGESSREKELSQELDGLTEQIRRLDAQLERDFPAYIELISPRPAYLKDVQKKLLPEEALLLQVTSEAGTFVFLVRNDRLRFYKSRMSAEQLQEAVSSLRAGLDIQNNRFSELPPFDTRSAYYIYENLLGPFEDDLNDIYHIVMVLDGALQNLPPNVLLARPAKKKPSKPADFRKLDFLSRHYAFSVMPSVSAFTTLRLNTGTEAGRKPFIGFGAPKLGGAVGSDTRGIGFELVKQSVTEIDPGNLQSKMAALPESEKELRAMAKLLHAEGDVLYFNERANETMVKTMNLSNFSTVAFATHALMTGEFRGLAEPALVLTPPAKADKENDGLLTASEVARLELNADWVILSACNTASPEGKPGAEGLSGLAKAFFYAGARSLMVSHWWVVSDSTVLLTTGAIEALAENPDIGRAEALRVSMNRLMDGEGDSNYAHPVFWAPFVLVGEGGPRYH